MKEIEVKIRVNDLESTKEKLISLGAQIKKEHFLEENTLYDFPQQTLYSKSQALRVRKSGKKAFLTFKGTPQKSRKFKIRDEYETEVKNYKHLKKILKSLGLIPVFSYKKYRTVLKKGKVKICLDETRVGNFIEMEGERNEIVKEAKAAGFSKQEFIKKDYVELLTEKEG
ncbi:MAG: class IV adenylate cyclase [Candidatus Aminicenantales bacterium]